MIFSIDKDKLKAKRPEDFSKERRVQRLVEKNLEELFKLSFLATEFTVDRFRFDTVAFDYESNAFIIIEYKKKKNQSLVDQGYAYLNTLLDRKADLVLLFNEVKKERRFVKDFDWSATRIYFVAPQFTEYQKAATGYRKMPFELFEINCYGKDILVVEEINERKITGEPVFSDDEEMKKVNREVIVYTEEDHFKGAAEATKELYDSLKESVLELGNIQVEPKKIYIAFKCNANNVCDVEVKKNFLKVFINVKKGGLKDSLRAARDISTVGHHGNGDYEYNLTTADDLDYLMSLIKQSFAKNG